MESPDLKVVQGRSLREKLDTRRGDFIMLETFEDSIEEDTQLVGGYFVKVKGEHIYLSTQHPDNSMVFFGGLFGMGLMKNQKYDLKQFSSYKILSREKPQPPINPSTGESY